MVGVDKMDQLMADHIGDAVKRGLHQLPGKGHPPFGGGAAAPAGGHRPHANLWHWHPKGGQLGLVLAAQLRGNGEAGLFQKGLHGLHPALRILRVRQREEKVRGRLPNLNLRTWLEAEGIGLTQQVDHFPWTVGVGLRAQGGLGGELVQRPKEKGRTLAEHRVYRLRGDPRPCGDLDRPIGMDPDVDVLHRLLGQLVGDGPPLQEKGALHPWGLLGSSWRKALTREVSPRLICTANCSLVSWQ